MLHDWNQTTASSNCYELYASESVECKKSILLKNKTNNN